MSQANKQVSQIVTASDCLVSRTLVLAWTSICVQLEEGCGAKDCCCGLQTSSPLAMREWGYSMQLHCPTRVKRPQLSAYCMVIVGLASTWGLATFLALLCAIYSSGRWTRKEGWKWIYQRPTVPNCILLSNVLLVAGTSRVWSSLFEAIQLIVLKVLNACILVMGFVIQILFARLLCWRQALYVHLVAEGSLWQTASRMQWCTNEASTRAQCENLFISQNYTKGQDVGIFSVLFVANWGGAGKEERHWRWLSDTGNRWTLFKKLMSEKPPTKHSFNYCSHSITIA